MVHDSGPAFPGFRFTPTHPTDGELLVIGLSLHRRSKLPSSIFHRIQNRPSDLIMIERSYMVESYSLWQPQFLSKPPNTWINQPRHFRSGQPTTPEAAISVVTHFLSIRYG